LRNALYEMKEPKNPFVIAGYRGPEYFCNREDELDWLIDQFNNDRNVVLYSWRRLGKTALIKHFHNYLETRSMTECLFVDLLGTTNISQANRKIAEAVTDRFGSIPKGISHAVRRLLGSIGATISYDPDTGAPQLGFNLIAPQEVPASLQAVGKFLTGRKKTVTVCLDEFQQIVNYSEEPAEAIFREWAQEFPEVHFVFSGSHRHMMTSMFSEANRPFYRSAQLKGLDPLPTAVYTDFIIHYFSKAQKQITQGQIDLIFQWSRRQTYYVQVVCNKLYGKSSTLSLADIELTFDEIIEQEIPVFSSYHRLFTSLQWNLLHAVALEEKVKYILSKDFLKRHDLGAASSVNTALQSLIKKEFIIQENDSYTLHDTLLMRWLQQI